MKVEIQGEAIVAEIEIEAPPDVVFDALVTPEDLAAWWGADGMYRTGNWRIDLRLGGNWSCEARGATGTVSTVHGVYTEVDRPRSLAYTWNPSWDSIPTTTVRYTLEPTARGTQVHVVHSGFAGQQKSQQGHTEGWQRVFGWLAAYCSQKKVVSK